MGLWEALVGQETPDGRYRFEACLEGRESRALFQVWDTVTAQARLGWVLAVNLFGNVEGLERWQNRVTLLQEVRDPRVGRYGDWGTLSVFPKVAVPFVLESLPTDAALPEGPLPPLQAVAIALDLTLAVAHYHQGLFVRNWAGQIVGRRTLAHGNLEPQHLYWTGDRPVVSGGGLGTVWAELRAVELAPLTGDEPLPEPVDDVRAIGQLLETLTGGVLPAPLQAVQRRAIAGGYPQAMALAAELRAVLPQLRPWYWRWGQKIQVGLRTPWWLIPLAAVGAGGLTWLSVPAIPKSTSPELFPAIPVASEPRERPPSQVRFVSLPPKPEPARVSPRPATVVSPPPVVPVKPPVPTAPIALLPPPVSQRPIAVLPSPSVLPPVRPAVPLLPAVESVNGDTIEVLLTAETSPSLASLWQSAEAAVGSAIERAFAESNRPEVRVLAIAERNRQRIPVLVTQVSRQVWQANPDVRPQSRYLSAAAPLLGFGGTARPATVAPAVSLPALSPAQRPPTLVPGRPRRATPPAASPPPAVGIPTAPPAEGSNRPSEGSDTR